MKALKYVLLTIVFLLGLSVAGIEYMMWKYNQSLTYALKQVEAGTWKPHMGYSRLLSFGTDEQIVAYVTRYIEEGEGEIMSNAIQMPCESDQEYLDRVNEGRRIMGFTPTTLQKLKSKRVRRTLYVPSS